LLVDASEGKGGRPIFWLPLLKRGGKGNNKVRGYGGLWFCLLRDKKGGDDCVEAAVRKNKARHDYLLRSPQEKKGGKGDVHVFIAPRLAEVTQYYSIGLVPG